MRIGWAGAVCKTVALELIVLRLIADVARITHKSEILGLGSIMSWYNAIEYIMVSAKAVLSYGIVTE